MNQIRIAVIGGGNMASALVKGLAGNVTAASNIWVVDVNPAALQVLAAQFGVKTGSDIAAAIQGADVILLAVKPQHMDQVLQEIAPGLAGQLVISLAAGLQTRQLSSGLRGHSAIVRAMPNTPALIGRGMTGLFAMAGVTPQQRELVSAMLSAVGKILWFDEEGMLDAVTGVSGSGPAYVFQFIEALQKAAQEVGISAADARVLAIETVAGAAQLAATSEEPVQVLRERVTSKGGTTFAGLTSLGNDGFDNVVANAVKAAVARSRELGAQ
ncbi:pyrroline-5-carboxylate reductase [Herbaspirillum autotrophicum]|uniref:pyrroline-5-carboxylate reductase n=1 Tax=Herbaspirillum autotrophicum TaxID=180195 RepID=UPI00067D9584|nr:pyrroline-5-carboxylate reductase [Herbaspirillum autotrophicum]